MTSRSRFNSKDSAEQQEALREAAVTFPLYSLSHRIVTHRALQLLLFGLFVGPLLLLLLPPSKRGRAFHDVYARDSPATLAEVQAIYGGGRATASSVPQVFEEFGGDDGLLAIATDSDEAQRCFDAGLLFLHAFDPPSALEAFFCCAAADPSAPLCLWGVGAALRWETALASAAQEAFALALRLAHAKQDNEDGDEKKTTREQELSVHERALLSVDASGGDPAAACADLLSGDDGGSGSGSGSEGGGGGGGGGAVAAVVAPSLAGGAAVAALCAWRLVDATVDVDGAPRPVEWRALAQRTLKGVLAHRPDHTVRRSTHPLSICLIHPIIIHDRHSSPYYYHSWSSSLTPSIHS